MIKKRLNQNEIEYIKSLIKSGSSLSKISKLTNRSKTTLYHHFRKIKGRTINPIQVNHNNKEIIGEFIGLFAGDGCFYKTKDYHYRVYLYFNVTEINYVKDLIKNVLLSIFDKRPMIFKPENRINLCYYSKNIYRLIKDYLEWNKNTRKTYSVRLKHRNHPKEFFIGFIRGSLDSDGYFSQNKINFSTVSPGLMEDISYSLDKLKIKHSVKLYKEKRKNRKDIYYINISKREHNKFINLVQPRNKWD